MEKVLRNWKITKLLNGPCDESVWSTTLLLQVSSINVAQKAKVMRKLTPMSLIHMVQIVEAEEM